MSGIAEPDALTLDALARLALAATRLGLAIRFVNANPKLVDLLAAVGLADVIGVSGVEMHGLVEHGEEGRVDEEVHLRDAVP